MFFNKNLFHTPFKCEYHTVRVFWYRENIKLNATRESFMHEFKANYSTVIAMHAWLYRKSDALQSGHNAFQRVEGLGKAITTHLRT